MSIQQKFIFTIAAVIGFFTVISAFITANETSKQVQKEIHEQQDLTSSQLLNILNVTDSLIQQRVKSSMKLLKERGLSIGTPSLGQSVTVKQTTANQLNLGGEGQANDFTLVDELTSVMGGTATLFSKTGNDFIRVSTNVVKDGKRATGTKLAPNGKAMANIKQGKAYYGEVDILGNPYLTGYEPMFDSSNKVIGIWYVGYSADLHLIEELITESRILGSGFVALRDGKGSIRMHSAHTSSEEIERALNGKNDEWNVSVIPYEKWGYDIILADELSEESSLVTHAVVKDLIKIIIANLIILGLVVYLIKRLVGEPLENFIAVVKDIASGEGDLTFRFNEDRNDEFGEMSKGFNSLLKQLQQTLHGVSETNNIMLEQAKELQKISVESAQTVQTLSLETDGISTAITELEQSSMAVSDNTNRASTAAEAADNDTRDIANVLQGTIKNIENQAGDLDSSVTVINELAKSSEDISGVMEVISNIAEQTNLLALNAAIEAARAGEQGRGFAVVADEVRSLASRTQESTIEIRNMIERLQAGSREASSKMQANKDNAFATVESTQSAGKSLEQSLNSVATISELNSQNVTMAEQQLSLTTQVSKRVSSIKIVGDENLQHANTVANNCEKLVQQLVAMDEQLKHYKF